MTTRFKLNTGAEIPAIGLGTWQAETILEGIKAGYRHIDTARIYGNEKDVGEAIKESGVPRDEFFVTTKLWNNKHHPDDVEEALQQSLNDLDLEYVDLFLMHWPVAWKRGDNPFPKMNGKAALEDVGVVYTYRAMEKLLKTGKTKAIGVSNFSKAEMETLLDKAKVIPAVHQIECHPWLQQLEFTEWHREKGIHVTHYSPFGNQNTSYGIRAGFGRLIDEPVLKDIGAQYDKSAAQVALAWGVSQGHSVLPKSDAQSHIESNLHGDFKLSPQDMEKIKTINRKMRFNDLSSGEFGRDFFGDLEDKAGYMGASHS